MESVDQQELQVTSVVSEQPQAEVPTLDMSTVLADGVMSNQLLQLIGNSIAANPSNPEPASTSSTSYQTQQPESIEQEPTNYDDTLDGFILEEVPSLPQSPTFALTETEINQHTQSIQTPIAVSNLDIRLISLREELNKLLNLQARGAQLEDQIRLKREEIQPITDDSLSGQLSFGTSALLSLQLLLSLTQN